ncbi:MAG TPA: lycopene cyclase family protein [Euzebyales bacterium]|nr:lycopene cyclase family protein [Euzebyales bacterium]
MSRSDVLVVGAGPAGRAAAAACARANLDVHLVAPRPDAAWPQTYGAWLDELTGAGAERLAGHQWAAVTVRTVGPTFRDLGRTYALIDNERLRGALTDGVDVTQTAGRANRLDVDDTGVVVTLVDGRRLAARAVVDATGHPAAFGRRARSGLAHQVAYGVVARFDQPPVAPGTMCLMDLDATPFDDGGPPTFLYAMDLGDGLWFTEETSLAARPAVPLGLLERRLRHRLAARGCTPLEIRHTERCAFAMNAPLPPGGPAIAFGAAAAMIHPATGYHVAEALRRAPLLAATVRDAMVGGAGPRAIARAGQRAVWTSADHRRDALYRLGLDVLLSLDTDATQAFFDGFFSLPPRDWQGYVSRTSSPLGVQRTMTRLMARLPSGVRRRVLRSVVADGSWRHMGRVVAPGLVSR